MRALARLVPLLIARLPTGHIQAAAREDTTGSALRNWATNRVNAAKRAEAGHPADSEGHRAMLASWKQTTGTHRDAATLFSSTSSMDAEMRVEVRERAEGWRTMHLVGARRSIIHGVCKADANGRLDPAAVPTEYIKSMAALGLAGLERRHRSEPARLLFLGLGAGTLPRLMGHYLPCAELVAIECDATVCDAAVECFGMDDGTMTVVRADALRWVEEAAGSAADDNLLFDAVFVDIFDEHNLCPVAFYSDAFLTALAAIMGDHGVVVHNLHAGSRRLEAERRYAEGAYARTFGGGRCCQLASLDSKPWAGNAILGAARPPRVEPADGMAAAAFFESAALLKSADAARRRLNVDFDLVARCRNVWRNLS